MRPTTTEETANAKDLVLQLIEQAKLTPQEISEALEDRVSARTIYRWYKGESVPGNSSDLKALQDLVRLKVGASA